METESNGVMSRNFFFILLLLAGALLPANVHADDLASTTPESVESVLATVPEEVPVLEVASTTEPLATSTETLTLIDLVPEAPPSVSITL